jgi:hypothetical protein
MEHETGLVLLYAPVVLGAGLLFFALRRPKTHKLALWSGSLIFLLGLIGWASSGNMIRWDGGGFGSAAFEITFVDRNGNPVEGVELRVENRDGHNFYLYPISDYLPDQIPRSDSHGLMVFHHFPDHVMFSGQEWLLWRRIWVQKIRGPRYILQFLHHGTEVHRVPFNNTSSGIGPWPATGSVKCRWKKTGWPVYDFLKADPTGYDNVKMRQLFDVDGDGRLGPEEANGYYAAESYDNEQAAIARLQGKMIEEEVELPLVQATIVIQP